METSGHPPFWPSEEYFFDHIPRLQFRQSFAKIGDRPVHVSIESFSKELLLVAKCLPQQRPNECQSLQRGRGQMRSLTSRRRLV